jgi:hypothetical protein
LKKVLMMMTTPKSKRETSRPANFAEGGARSKMFREQAANPQKPGGTAHDVKGGAPGAKSAKGGPPARGTSTALPAASGHTAPPKKGR